MHDFLRSLPCAGALGGVFGAILTVDGSIRTAAICLAIAAASVVYMHIDGRYGVD